MNTRYITEIDKCIDGEYEWSRFIKDVADVEYRRAEIIDVLNRLRELLIAEKSKMHTGH